MRLWTRAVIPPTEPAAGSPALMRMWPAALLAVLVAGALTGCDGGVAVPRGGHALHVTVTGDDVHLEPATMPAGDIYLVLDTPGTDVTLVEAKASADATPGPLTDDDLDRVRHGDTFHTSLTGGFANGGPHGNVTKLTLTPGTYAFVADAPEALAGRSGGVIPPGAIAVLQALP